jgi:YidC/Oxa1 family membrane protein insertase
MEKRSFLFVCALSLSFFFINNYLFDRKESNTEVAALTESFKKENTPSVKPVLISDNSSASETFYVLENNYQQLVFSTKGGSIAEINLPFPSKENKESVVLPIQFDKTIEEKSTSNAKFPLNPYKTFENGMIVDKDPKTGGYSPLLRRSLKNDDGSNISELSSKYYAFNIISEKALDETSWCRINRMGEDFIEFISEANGQTITKTYRIPKETPYTFELEVNVEGNGGDLWVTSGLLEVELVSGSYSPLLQYYTVDAKGKKAVEKIKLPKVDTSLKSINALWTSSANGFFGMIIDPISNPQTDGLKVKSVSGEEAPSRLTLIDREYDLYPAKDYPAYQILIPYKQETTAQKFISYSGPYSSKVLNRVDSTLSNPKNGIGANREFSKVVIIQGWITFITEPFSRFLFILMQFFYMITRSWGISIILLTLALRVMLYPLNAWAYKSTAKMQQLSPKLTALQEKFKADPKRLHTETAMLYKTEGVNPFSGCLPMFIQFPFLIGMFDLLKSTFELRGVGFIPGWINNLTAPDVLFSWHYPIVFIGTNFHLLPFILGGLMYLQAKVGAMQQGQKGPLTEQQQQLKTAGNVMTIVFTFMFYNMPSGLNIYWIFSTLFGMLQQWFMIRRFQNNPKILKKS